MSSTCWGKNGVLIVDDEPAVCSVIQGGLRNRGIPTTVCTQGVEAKQLLADRVFGVLIADITMPDIDGMELLAHAKETSPDCKVILITGYPSTDRLAKALSLGAYEFFAKPFSIGALADTVIRAVGDDSASDELPVRAARAMEMKDQMAGVTLESIRALTRAVEAKDPYTHRHSEQVAHYAAHLSEWLGMEEERIESIRIASLLHDIGKIGVPDAVLTKPGGLTEDEFDLVRQHPALGAEILQHISRFAVEAMLVRHHHENWDGTGYPDRLTGEEIPYGARVINVADSVDAMLMKRTYKDAYSVERMIDELRRCAGTQFCPDIALAAIDWCESNPEKILKPDGSNEVIFAA